jgi:hypothetical protein
MTRTVRPVLATALLTLAAALVGPASAFAAGEEPAGGAAIGEVVIATAGAGIVTFLMLWFGFGHRTGRTRLLKRVSDPVARATGLPSWVALPSLVSTASLITALLGMYWDISLHIDVGRDAGPLANPAHYLILIGLYGIFAAGFFAAVLTEGKPSDTAVRIGRDWYAPLGAVLMSACGAFSLIAFPLDDMWHRLFGQDVTLWGPTHLMLIGGAALSLVGQSILLAEGSRSQESDNVRRMSVVLWLRRAALAGALLIGLSTFQAEFDFGVPQFDFLFHPMLIAIAAAVGLVSARIWSGPGAALSAVAFFLLIRGFVSVTVGPVFGETTPHLPLYLGEAVIVEALAAWMTLRRPLAFGAVAGALVGTVGLATEWGWMHVWSATPWPESLLPEAFVVGLAAGLAGGVIGALIGCALRTQPAPLPRSARIALPVAAATIVALVVIGLSTAPRSGVTAQVSLRDVPGQDGRHVAATVAIDPPSAAEGARWINVTSWQGGGLVVDHLEEVRPGVYRTTEPIPVHGEWKSMVRLHVGRSITAVPIFLPEDEAIPANEVPAAATFTRTFVADKSILQREAKEGAAVLSALGYGVVLLIAASLLALLAWGLARTAQPPHQGPPAERPAGRSRPGTRPVPA